MEQYGNATFNMERVLRENIVASEYFRRDAKSMRTWDELIDETYRSVDHVEPWMSGNVRGPSTAFCLLHRLFELKPTEEQIQDTVSCKDSPYIRAIGFLYLRYVCPPDQLLDWFGPHFCDRQNFWPSGEGFGKQVTIGEYAIDLLMCQNYFETIFTRIPKKVSDVIVRALQEAKLPSEAVGNGGQGGPDRRGGDDGRARPASVKASLSVALGQRAPNRAGVTEDASQRISRREDMSGDTRNGSSRPAGTMAPPPERSGRAADGGARSAWPGDPPRRSAAGDDHGGRRAADVPRDREREARRYEDQRERPPARAPYERERDGRPRHDGYSLRSPPPRHAGGDRTRGDWRDARHDTRRPAHGNGRSAPASSVFGRSAADVFGKSSARATAPPVVDDAALGLDGELGALDEPVKIGRRRR